MKSYIKKALAFTLMSFIITSCGSDSKSDGSTLSGVVKVDGSSTVFPITEAVAEEFGKKYPKVRVTVGISGTGGGFKKFCSGEIDINDASDPYSRQVWGNSNGIINDLIIVLSNRNFMTIF